MTTFTEEYAAVYDLLYGGKNYAEEAAFVLDRLRAHGTAPRTLLDIGCGTGRHAEAFARDGVDVHGADLSDQMIRQALHRCQSLPADVRARLAFSSADVRALSVGQTFDAAAALFHVISYLTDNESLDRAFQSIRRHLAPGAPFLFDFWYGPAIHRDGVERRERSAESDLWQVTRITEPVWEKDRDMVRVNFHITGRRKADQTQHHWHEEHPMRYFDEAFLTDRLSAAGFRVVETGQWLTRTPPVADDLGAYLVAVAA